MIIFDIVFVLNEFWMVMKIMGDFEERNGLIYEKI